MNFNETSPTLNCGNILPQFLQEKVINLKIGEKTYNQGWGNLTIGRSHFNDVIIKDKSVSAFHANLEVCSRGIFITDHNSTNFTYINNVQIPARERMAVCQGSSQSSVKFGEVFCIIEFQHPTNLPATPERVRHTSSSPEKLNDSVILLDENKEVNNDHAADHHHESREEIDLSSSGVDIENNNDNDNETEETRSKSLNCPQASVDCRRYHDNEDDNKDRVINIIHSLSQNLQINQSNNKDNNDQKEYDGNDDNRLNNEDDDDNNNEDDDHHNNNEGDDHHKNNNEDDDNNDNKTEAEEEISTRSLVRPQTSVNYRRHHDNEGNRVKKITHRLFVCHEINPSDDESNSDEEEDDNGND
ncbi:GSCOCG00009469001-RA-CDS, partial [Cotesia congregata]